MRGTQVAQHNAWHTIRASKKCELLLSFITHALAAPPFIPCKTLEPHFYFPGRKFLSHFRVAPSPPIKTFFRPGQAKAPHRGGKTQLARGRGSERERLANRPRGAPGPRDRPGARGGGRSSLSPHVAVGRGTRTRRTRPRAPAGGRRASARPCSRLRPLRGGGRGRASRERRSDLSLSQELQLVLDPGPPRPAHTPAYLRG